MASNNPGWSFNQQTNKQTNVGPGGRAIRIKNVYHNPQAPTAPASPNYTPGQFARARAFWQVGLQRFGESVGNFVNKWKNPLVAFFSSLLKIGIFVGGAVALFFVLLLINYYIKF